jgi:hypothetical protein
MTLTRQKVPIVLPSSTVAADFGAGEWWLNRSRKAVRRRRTARAEKVISINQVPLAKAQEYTSEVKPGIKKGARGAFFTSACLELVNQAQSNDVVGRDTGVTGEAVVVQQVDFVVNVGGHVFVEVVGRANINIFQEILVAVAFESLPLDCR